MRRLALPAVCLWLGTCAVQGAEVRPSERPLDRVEALAQSQAELVLPPVPSLSRARSQASERSSQRIQGLRFTGVTVFERAELEGLLAAYLIGTLNTQDILELASTITRHYVENGYVSSGARIANLPAADGILEIQVTEARLVDVEIEGTTRYRPEHLSRRLLSNGAAPLHAPTLKRELQLLQSERGVRRIQAELVPLAVGETRLRLRIEEESALSLRAAAGNNLASDLGGDRGWLEVTHANVLGFGDRLSAGFGAASGLDEWSARYDFPLGATPFRVELGARQNRSKIVEGAFRHIDVESESSSWSIGLRAPLHRSQRAEFWLGVRGELRRSETSLLGDPFSFVAGVDEGEARLSVLRITQDWAYSSEETALGARSTFSFGLQALGATDRHIRDAPDASFQTWLGQVQLARQLPQKFASARVVFRGALQLSRDPLFSLEQFALGGGGSVRGYPENRLVRDNGWSTSLEVRVPIWEADLGGSRVELVPFADAGRVWNQSGNMGPKTLLSSGLGLRWRLSDRLLASVYWGGRLREIDDTGRHLQKAGFHWSITTSFQ